MDLKLIFFSFFSILFSMVILDAIWLGLMLKRLYYPQIGHLMETSPKLLPAVIFYLIFAFALSVFVVIPAFQNLSPFNTVFLLGMLFGLVTYGTYDLTNQATLKSWPPLLTIIDLVWGSVLTGTVSVIALFICKRFL